MKVGLVYTTYVTELVEVVEREVKKQLGDSVELLIYKSPEVLEGIKEAGYVTKSAAAKMVQMYMEAVLDGAEAVLNICSSVGEVADVCNDLGKYMGVPIVRIDEEMCKEAVRKGAKIGVLATLPTTLEPTKRTILKAAREMGRQVILVEGLVDAFGTGQEKMKEVLVEKAKEMSGEADVILLAQGSMACCEEAIQRAVDKVVVSSPRFGALALKKALVEKGLY